MNVARLLGVLNVPNVIRSRMASLGWARLTIGLGIGSKSLRAVGVSAGSVRWAIELQREDGDSLEASLATLLSRCPLQKQRRALWTRPQVAVAIGPSFVQVKRLTGLPQLRDPAALTAVVREGARRFFLKNGVPLLTTSISLIEPGTGWAAAFEAPVVEQVQRACLDAGFTLRAVVPATVALGQVVRNGELSWTDGHMRTELVYGDCDLKTIRQVRVPHDGEHPEGKEPLLPHAALESSGDRAMQYADAFGATRVGRGAWLAAAFGKSSRAGSLSQTRLRIAATAFCVSIIAALSIPPLLAARSVARARERLALVAPQVRQARTIERDLGEISSTLERVSKFAADRRSVTTLLARITAALPKQAAIVTLEVDSTRGTIVALAPRASQVTDALERVNGVASPQVVGPITPMTTRSGEVERVTVRFWLVQQAGTQNATTVGDAHHAPAVATPPAMRSATASASGDSQ